MSAGLALPWLAPVLAAARALGGAHALLLHGAEGDGLFDAAQTVVQSWLCEADDPAGPRPCGRCSACVQAAARTHPDLHPLLPEVLARQLGTADAAADAADDGEGKARRKPSRQIRIDEVRAAIDWVSTSSSRGRGKVVLIHPAEAMNLQAANALLKTLEEPPARARLLLSTSQPALLLPTVRSRCQLLRLVPPSPALARRWLHQQGVADADVLLAAASGRPLDAAALAAAGITGAHWAALPAAVLQRQAAAFAGWPLPRVLDALHKLCHDGFALAAGAAPRFFPAASLPRPSAMPALAAWSRELARFARHVDHPWNEGLAVDALLQQASDAWVGRAPRSDTLPV